MYIKTEYIMRAHWICIDCIICNKYASLPLVFAILLFMLLLVNSLTESLLRTIKRYTAKTIV